MEIALLIANQNEFSQRRRCLSCKAQMDQPSASREGPATKVETEAHITEHSLPALFDIPVVSRYDIYSLAQHLNRKIGTLSRGFAVHVL